MNAGTTPTAPERTVQNSYRLGFTPTRLAVLRFIDEPDAFRSVPVRPQHYTVAVRALKAAGLVRENTDPTIRRALVLTEDGVQALTEARLAETTFDPQRAADRVRAEVAAETAAPAPVDDPRDYTPAQWNLRVLDRRVADLRERGHAGIADTIADCLNRDDEQQVQRALGHVVQLLVEDEPAPARTVELTDLIDPENTATVPLEQVAAAIRGWYPETLADPDNCTGCIAALADIEKAGELQAALIAADLVTAAELAGEIGIAYDVRPA